MTFEPGKSGNPAGKPKGTLNRFTRLQNAILDGIEVAAKDAGFSGSTDYIAEMMKDKRDRSNVLAQAVKLIPKTTNSNVNLDETLGAVLAGIAKKAK